MNGYPTDEDLELLISQLEKQELYAPKHMKEQILNQAFPKQAVEIFPQTGSRTRSVQTFTYRLKIITGMAAALVMLMLIPFVNERNNYETDWQMTGVEQVRDEQQAAHEEKNVNINERFGERTRKINRKFQSWFEQVNSFGTGILFNEEDGGIYDEN